MTNFLSQVSTGPTDDGQRIIIAGVEKIGKTTLMANAPRCLTIQLEKGTASILTPKTPLITAYDDLLGLMKELELACQRGTNQYKSFGFDSATALERLIHDKVLSNDPDMINFKMGKTKEAPKNLTMETAHGGYGKAYNLANNLFSSFLDYCDMFSHHGKVNIIFTCHVFASRIVDPSYGEYDSWDLLLHSPKNNKTYGKREIMTQWADMIGFLHEPLYVVKGDKRDTLTRGVSANQGRLLAVDRAPQWVAGNRYKLTGALQIPELNGWNVIANAMYNSVGIDVWNRDV